MLIVGLVTLAAMAGAVMGAVVASVSLWMRHLLPFSAGLLVGMSLLLMAPEAFADGAKPTTLASFGFGFLMVSAIEKFLHRMRPDPHQTWAGVIPVATAIAVHSMLDGWNIVVALTVSSAGAWAFAGAMALHKITGGFAIGAVIRAAVPQRGGAVAIAAMVEATTVVGAGLFVALRSSSGDAWTTSVLSATAGSLLYLGIHTLRRALEVSSRTAAAIGAAAGSFTIWLISLMSR
jgi:zinc transporter ZupT